MGEWRKLPRNGKDNEVMRGISLQNKWFGTWKYGRYRFIRWRYKNDGVNLQLKANGILIADERNQDTILQMKNVLENNSKGQIIAFLELGYVCLIICLILYRMTLSRLEKLFININEGDTPFTLENVKYIKEMAKLMIIALILPSGGGIIFEKILATDLDVGFELFDIVQILFLFGISYIFEYGYELQQDTKAKMYGEVSDNE